jgi:hypothetical protein
VPIWSFCCYEDGDQTVFAYIEDGRWEKTPVGDVRQALDALLPRRQAAPSLARDAVFLEALRDAALLASLDGEASLRCKIREDQRPLAEAVVHDLYGSALPRLQFLPFAAGTVIPPAPGVRLLLATDLPEGGAQGACVDFTAGQPTLELNFPRLNFAQRAVRGLLGPLGLGLLLSMWNAAGQAAQERLGARRAAQYADLVAWLMLRRNFPGNEYAVTGAEHEQLRRRVEEYESCSGGAD